LKEKNKDITKKSLIGNPVLVEWVDSMGSSGWHQEYKISSLKCTTIGHYYAEYQDRIVVALNKSEYCYGDYMDIPRLSIKKITMLKK